MRGQTSIADLFVTVIVFVMAFTIFMTLSDRSTRDAFFASRFSEATVSGTSVTESLVGNPGVPPDWQKNPAAAYAIGLMTDQNRLDDAKLAAFVAMNYNISKIKMGLQPYLDYHFEIISSSNVTLYSSGIVPSDKRSVFPLSRSVMVDGQRAEMRLTIYG